MPGVKEEHPVEIANTVVGMAERAGKLAGLDGTEQTHPALVERIE